MALDVHTGAVRVLAGTPSYDPEQPEATARPFNRATQGLYPPGSTFKIVTAAAAHRHRPVHAELDGQRPQRQDRSPARRCRTSAARTSAPITLTDALTTRSTRCWRRSARSSARRRWSKYMERFGFDAKPPMDYPADQMIAERRLPQRPACCTRRSRFIDVGRMAIGQEQLLVTPLQMATVAQTIGNGGVRMEPRLVQRVVDPDGRTRRRRRCPSRPQRVMSPGHRGQADRDDEAAWSRRAPAPRPRSGRRGGRQDRHRRDRHRQRHQRPLVHRLHADATPSPCRDRARAGRPRAAPVAAPDRQAGPRRRSGS